MKKWNLVAACAVLGIAGLAGCTNNERTDTPAERAGRDTAYAGGRAADRAENKTEGAFRELKKDTKEAVAAVKVKNAFMTHDKIDAEEINVDAKEMTIHLYGTVASAQEKMLAEQVAKKTAGPEFKVMSHLKVGKAKKGAE